MKRQPPAISLKKANEFIFEMNKVNEKINEWAAFCNEMGGLWAPPLCAAELHFTLFESSVPSPLPFLCSAASEQEEQPLNSFSFLLKTAEGGVE